MADSTVTDVSKMKVVDLRKELKSRGLACTGDKAGLIARLQRVMSQDVQDEHADINLDSDEIDSDGVLEEDDKTPDILDSTVDTLNEALALEEQPPPIEKTLEKLKPQKTLKRKLKIPECDKEKTAESKEAGHKKIILNRAISVSSITPQTETEKADNTPVKSEPSSESNKIKITADLDTKTKLELRAKRFGLPVKVTDNERKEARKLRFGQNVQGGTLVMDQLKKRAERFGQSVSKVMTELENKERLEKRKAKFGIAK